MKGSHNYNLGTTNNSPNQDLATTFLLTHYIYNLGTTKHKNPSELN